MNHATTPRTDYGLDAPTVVRNLLLLGAAAIIAGVALRLFLAPEQPELASIFLSWGLGSGISMMASAGMMIWSSRVGKLRYRERLIDSFGLRGDETVLDVGCGRGLLLNAAARRLTTGRAIGVDLWQSVDQSGNRPEATRTNADAEGVASRIEILTGDMRALPLADDSVDVVVSSIAIHNVPDTEGRAQAVREIARVLKPGGRLALLDFQKTSEYAETLRKLGWKDVARSGPSFRMYPPVRVVTGTKPPL